MNQQLTRLLTNRCFRPKSSCAGLLVTAIAGVFILYSAKNNGYHIQLSYQVRHSPNSWRNNNTIKGSPKLPPHQHVYYLKTHKTGSTTMFSILAEYARSHDLIPLVPNGNHINQSPPFRESQLLINTNVKKYHMLFHHHIHTPEIFKYLHNDTFTFTTLREPFSNFVSAFTYYKNVWHRSYLMRIGSKDPLMEFLLRHDSYEDKTYISYTNNRQSLDLGYDMDNHSFKDIGYIKRFINTIDRRFDLVLITEYFDESLIILKRALHWNTQDILYITKNKSPSSAIKRNSTKETLQRKLHAQFSKADIMLYQHFLARFKKVMIEQRGIKEEVAEFKQILVKVRDYCDHYGKNRASLVIPLQTWSDGFELSPVKCKWLYMDEKQTTNYLHERHRQIDNDMKDFVRRKIITVTPI